MNKAQQSKINWLVLGGISVLIILVIFGYRINNISLNLGPVSVGMDKPTPLSQQEIEVNPVSQLEQPTQVEIGQQPTPQVENVDFNPSLSLPFYDDFEDGPDPLWRTSGNFLVNDGRLAGADTVTMEIGNNTLKTYVVEFDVYSPSNYCSWNYNNYLVIGVTPTLQYHAAYTDVNSRGRWYALQEGDWKEIARDDIGVVANQSCNNTVRVFVDGNSYEIHANGSLTTKLVYGDSNGAPFMIGTSQTPHIDNLRISQP